MLKECGMPNGPDNVILLSDWRADRRQASHYDTDDHGERLAEPLEARRRDAALALQEMLKTYRWALEW
jgi:hypothetical protein